MRQVSSTSKLSGKGQANKGNGDKVRMGYSMANPSRHLLTRRRRPEGLPGSDHGLGNAFPFKDPVSKNLSSEVSMDAASGGTMPLELQPKMKTPSHRLKQEFLDNYAEEVGTLSAHDTSADGAPENVNSMKHTTRWVMLKEDHIGQGAKYPRIRLRKMSPNTASQVNPNTFLGTGNAKESSNREPSYHKEDINVDEGKFHAKKYRSGIVTLEAIAMTGVVHDISIGHIFSMLEGGLGGSNSHEDARQALQNAQRQITNYNLKKAGAKEGSLQNVEVPTLGSCVVVFVLATRSYQRGRLDCWTYTLAQSVAKYFSTEYCFQKLKVVFYGIAQNAKCAGVAFAAIFNRISVLSADYIPGKLWDVGDLGEIHRAWGCTNNAGFSKKLRLAYRKELMEALLKIPKRQ